MIALALAFDFLNGFHDAANSIATVVSTGVLRPYQAVAWAACFNFVAFALFKLNVAATVGKGILAPEFVDAHVIASALTGAIAWNLITWYYGIPTSSSHALIGGMIGAGVAKAGTAPLVLAGIIKTMVFIVISPLLGLLLGATTHGGGLVDTVSIAHPTWSISGSADCSWSLRRFTALGTAATMRRRPWG